VPRRGYIEPGALELSPGAALSGAFPRGSETVNFLNLSAFGLLGLVPVIVLLYLLKLKRKPQVVSSTLLWFRAVQDLEANAPFQRLRKNLLLFLQLLILLLLVLALARPYLQAATRVKQSIAVILDRSASMQATDVAPSRFEAAVEKAQVLIGDLSEGDRMMLIAASHQAQVLQAFTEDKEQLYQALRSVEAVDTETDLTEAFLLAQSLLQNQPGGEMVILSDGGFGDLPPLAVKGVRARYVPFGQRCENLALSALDIRSDPAAPGTYQLFASVSNLCSAQRTADLELYVDGAIVDSQPLTLPPGESRAEVFRVSGVERGILEVRLDVEDDLAVDNRAYAVFAPEETTEVLLVGPPIHFLQRALALDPRVSLSQRESAEGFEAGRYDLVLFNGECPPDLSPNGNYVFFACAPESWAAKVSGPAIEYPPIVDWNRAHPLLRFVSLDNVAIVRTLQLESPPAAEILVESLKTPLLALSIEQGRFFSLFVPFDLLDSNWMLRASFPILITNLVDFCRDSPGGGGAFSQQTTGRPVPLFVGSRTAADTLEVRSPAGVRYSVPIVGDPVYFTSTERAGLYEVTAAGRERESFAVNLLSLRESNIAPRAEIQLGSETLEGEAGELKTNQEIWKSLAVVALLILLAEWWVYHRRIGV